MDSKNYKEIAKARMTRSYSQNPFIHSIFAADPSAHVWGDRLYVYASRDIDPAIRCDTMDYTHVFSTDDMVNWRDEGEIWNSNRIPWGRSEGGFIWAPDCAYKNGTYYYYYPHPSGDDWNRTWKIGVAVSDRPASGFKDAGYIEGLGGFAMIDPCVFIDDDGRAYMYYGGGCKCEMGELNEDMVSLKGPMLPLDTIYDFHEGPWVFKRNGVYYLIYADGTPWGANLMHYATSEKPLGPWKYRGVFMQTVGCETTHGSLVEFKGKWYMFYHRTDISQQDNLRSLCVDEVKFEDDGSIAMLVQTKNGVPAVCEASCPYSLDRLYLFSNNEQSEIKAVNGKLISDERSEFEVVASELCENSGVIEIPEFCAEIDGRYTIGILYGSPGLSKCRVFVDGVDYSLINLTKTGNLRNYTGFSCLTVDMNAGAHKLELRVESGVINAEAVVISSLDTK